MHMCSHILMCVCVCARKRVICEYVCSYYLKLKLLRFKSIYIYIFRYVHTSVVKL